MKILEEIKQHKIKEVLTRKEITPAKLLEQSPYFSSSCFSMKEFISDQSKNGIIAEFKRKSPSKGEINQNANVQEVTQGYIQAGASALSVLTDELFFGAKSDDLHTARKFNHCPILRKDFVIDEYQIIEAKSIGADVILLIAKMLSPKEITRLSDFAKKIGLEVFIEFHNEIEILENENASADLVGINNRNLNSFKVDIENSIRLANILPENVLKIAESGIDSAQTILKLRENGFDGFLIGEYFMRHSAPSDKCKELIIQLTNEN
jgi:indole-3-glycerol phosphate synthase